MWNFENTFLTGPHTLVISLGVT